MTMILLALGLVLVVEGLALALAPLRIIEVLRMLVALGRDRCRMLGLGAVALGVVLIWITHILAV